MIPEHPKHPTEDIPGLPRELARCAIALTEMIDVLAGSKEWSYSHPRWLKIPNFVTLRIVPTKKKLIVSLSGPRSKLGQNPAPELSLKKGFYSYWEFTFNEPAQLADAVLYICRAYQHYQAKHK